MHLALQVPFTKNRVYQTGEQGRPTRYEIVLDLVSHAGSLADQV